MQGMLLVPAAILFQLDFVLELLLIARTVIVDVLTDRALEFDEIILRHEG